MPIADNPIVSLTPEQLEEILNSDSSIWATIAYALKGIGDWIVNAVEFIEDALDGAYYLLTEVGNFSRFFSFFEPFFPDSVWSGIYVIISIVIATITWKIVADTV